MTDITTVKNNNTNIVSDTPTGVVIKIFITSFLYIKDNIVSVLLQIKRHIKRNHRKIILKSKQERMGVKTEIEMQIMMKISMNTNGRKLRLKENMETGNNDKDESKKKK